MVGLLILGIGFVIGGVAIGFAIGRWWTWNEVIHGKRHEFAKRCPRCGEEVP